MNRRELLKHYYNEYSTQLLKNYVAKLSKNKESILEFSEINYHKTKENFLIKFEINDTRGRGFALSYLDILYKVIDLYHKFEDEELNQMLKSL